MKTIYPTRQVFDISNWASLSYKGLDSVRKGITETRETALRMRVEGCPVPEITAATKLSRSVVYDLFKRAQIIRPDGLCHGFTVCLYYKHIKNYKRSAPICTRGSHGYAGAFQKFLDDHPDIEEALLEELFQEGRGKYYEVAVRGTTLFESFLKLCTKAGVRNDEYPLSLETKGRQALLNTIENWKEKQLKKMIALYGPEDAPRKLGSWGFADKFKLQPFQRCEFDGHKIDVFVTIGITLPDGRKIFKTMRRIWLLVVRECGTGAILSYHLVLNSEYNSEDVLTCFEKAIIPWEKRKLTVDGMEYTPNGGMPSGSIPALAYAYCNEVTFDNAKANGQKIESWVWSRLKTVLGCQINPGPVGDPDQRLIELFFKILAANGFQRIPGTTGSNPKDHKKKDDAEKTAKALKIEDWMIEDLAAACVWKYNGELNELTPGHSPIERLKFLYEGGNNHLVRIVPESERPKFCLTIKTDTRPVLGNVKQGRRPYINFLGARYSSKKLLESPSLRGVKVTVEARTSALRTVDIFLPDGTFFGELTALGGWALSQHDLKMRKLILDLRNQKKLSYGRNADPVKALLDYLNKQALKNKRERNQLAHARRVASKGAVKPATEQPTPKERPVSPHLPQTKTSKKYRGHTL